VGPQRRVLRGIPAALAGQQDHLRHQVPAAADGGPRVWPRPLPAADTDLARQRHEQGVGGTSRARYGRTRCFSANVTNPVGPYGPTFS